MCYMCYMRNQSFFENNRIPLESNNEKCRLENEKKTEIKFVKNLSLFQKVFNTKLTTQAFTV
jgi:hypothetical protein